MSARKTIDFLPKFFRTEANQKFLASTLDQLVSEPVTVRLDGYVGRKVAINADSIDKYVPEISPNREHYQLEPGVVVRSQTGTIDFVSDYQDLISKLSYLGSDVTDHSRLFNNEYYNYSGLIDFDKFVNFSQYYWLPNGPDAVDVFTTPLPMTDELTLSTDISGRSVIVSSYGTVKNPTIILARGGTYTFKSNTPGGIYIQTEPGASGQRATQKNLSSRTVLGVSDNGSDTVTFTVPSKGAQDFYLRMEQLAGANVDLVTTLKYRDIQGKKFKDIADIDMQRSISGKRIIFLFDGFDLDSYWTHDGITIPEASRYGIWRINDSTDPEELIYLSPVQAVPVNTKVFIREGQVNGNKEFYKNSKGRWEEVPHLTAIKDVLYYQDPTDESLSGEIRLIDTSVSYSIDVDVSILGKRQYISPNGVEFTNGLKIRFDTDVTPASYADRTFYVEGVGDAIRLIDATLLITPESFMESTVSGGIYPSYLVINRASKDLNPWSRGNRWFHYDVIEQTARYNNTSVNVDQSSRASRPIIEFEADLELYNFAKIGKAWIDLIDTEQQDVMSNVEGTPSYIVDGVSLQDGMRVIFAADLDPSVRNKIYEVRMIDPDNNGSTQIHFELMQDGVPSPYDGVVVVRGDVSRGLCYWFTGDSWVIGQQRAGLSSHPMFNVYDSAGVSFSNVDKYPQTTFSGNKIFSYRVGNGSPDPVLNFPLSYRNFSNVGDIVFDNNYVTDTFSYLENDSMKVLNVSTGYFHKTVDRDTFNKKNTWERVEGESKQYQVFSFVYEGDNRFLLGINPNFNTDIPGLKVFVNNRLEKNTSYRVIEDLGIPYLEFLAPLNANDKVDVYVYSDSVSATGYFQIPSNLDNNSVNENFETITLGQMRNHVEQVFNNSIDSVGSFPGSSNLRDLAVKNVFGRILQHSAPTVYANLFLTHPIADFNKSLDFARREYTRFKNKFLELAYTANIDVFDPVVAVDDIMQILASYKTSDMPWFRSDMVPYGSNKDVITYTISDELQRSYELSYIFDSTTPSNRAVLVYLDGEQLVRGLHYEFSDTRPAILLINDFRPAVGSVLRIVEYADTDGSWVPETPSKLGLYPAFRPEIVRDTSYRSPIDVIVGHDGSRTVAFGDFRDQLLLELEKRIFNNIKTKYDSTRLDINDFVPGKFRKLSYAIGNITRPLSMYFLKWVGVNRLNFSENPYYDNSDGFTWVYRKFLDKISGEPLPGNWRGIFRYFYDTERPNQTPWEMLGFSERPNWWIRRYGPAPYTSGNKVLWQDIEDGRILEGDRAGIDTRYSRPGLSQIIPVNEYGDLISPHEFIVKEYDTYRTNLEFIVGDVGPVESAWRNSSEYPFALQYAIALLNPAKYFGLQVDTKNYYRDNDIGQYLFKDTNQRLTRNLIKVSGEEYDGEIFRTSGYLNWIANYTRSLGLDAKMSVGDLVQNFDVQLSYKMSGFSDKTLLKFFAEQASPTSTNSNILIPDEDYQLVLTKSPPVRVVKYSGVIIKKTDAGWSVEGYDLENPYFHVIPVDTTSTFETLTIFDVVIKKYEKSLEQDLVVPYGTEFYTKQQVVDFLLGYERFLKSTGLIFERVSTELKEIQNWTLSSKEFLTWSSQGWGPGNIIVLSPSFNGVLVKSENATVDMINDPATNNKVTDVNFNPYNSVDFSVNRGNGVFELTSYAGSIGYAELNLVQYEHVAVFNNITVFNDILYQPSLGNRQTRLKVVGKKTGDWDGTLNAPGFILNQDNIPEWQPGVDYKKADLVRYKAQLFVASMNIPATSEFDYSQWTPSDFSKIKTGLLPNFATKSKQIADGYDIENINLESDIDILSKGLIGFRSRDYLNEIGIADSSQVKFYQGYIREKGTRNSIDAFTSARVDRLNNDIRIYEDWAIRVGEYGALDSTQSIELVLPDDSFGSSPSFLQLISDDEARPYGNSFKQSDLYRRPLQFKKDLFLTMGSGKNLDLEISTAGPVRIDDIDFTVFDIEDIASLGPQLEQVGVDDLIWVAKDRNNSWNVYRVDQTNIVATSLVNVQDGFLFVETAQEHTLVIGDLIVIKNTNTLFDGFYRIVSKPSLNSFIVEAPLSLLDGFTSVGDLSAYVLILKSVKFKHATDAATFALTSGWRANDKFWVDDESVDRDWLVYKKSEPWNLGEQLASQTKEGLGSVISVSSDGNLLVTIGSSGTVSAYLKDTNTGEFVELSMPSVEDIATAISVGTGNNIAVGYSQDGVGTVRVFSRTGTTVELEKEIPGSVVNALTGDEFGDSVKLSDDEKWLYVGAPGSNSVYAFYRTNSGYCYAEREISCPDCEIGDRFGHALDVSTDGAQVIVSAPNHGGVGNVYVYDRIVEAFIAQESQTKFTTQRPLNMNVIRVTVDQVEVPSSDYTVTGQTVTLDVSPNVGSVVRIEVNDFSLIQKLSASAPGDGNQFGAACAICNTNCSVYIGAPNKNSDGLDNFLDVGQVYRYINQGRVYGTIVGTVQAPIVSVGHSLRLDDFEVIFTGSTLDDVVDDINNYNETGIPGIRAYNEGGYLKLVSDSLYTFSKLRVLPGLGTAIVDLGLEVFKEIQIINNPDPSDRSQFGTSLAISQDSAKLVVGAPRASAISTMLFDDGLTRFDDTSTVIKSIITNTGAAYVFEQLTNFEQSVENPPKFVLVQRLTEETQYDSDRFGSSVAIATNFIAVGAPGSDIRDSDGDVIHSGVGEITTYRADTNAWNITTRESARVDLESINSAFIYNRITGKKLASLNVFDPAKGRILGTAAQELDFITDYDPAYYNAGDTNTLRPALAWGKEHVGMLWWDTSVIRYMDYEQGDFAYRSSNWGRVFPGSEVHVYQWVESLVPPSSYIGIYSDGIPKNINDVEFVEASTIDEFSGAVVTRYYFWVRATSTILRDSKKLSTIEIAELIENPLTTEQPIVAFLSPSSVGLWNIDDHLVSDEVVLHVDYDVVKNENIIHSEFSLIQENIETSTVPAKVVRKLVDSLCGFDASGNPVPDPLLTPAESIGILFRPRQSAFVDQNAALKVFVDTVNQALSKEPVVENRQLSELWFRSSPVPNTGYSETVPDLTSLSYIKSPASSEAPVSIPNGYSVLVNYDSGIRGWAIYTRNGSDWVRTSQQTFNTMNFWNYQDWYADGYNANNIRATYVVNNDYDVEFLPRRAGDIIRVKNAGGNKFKIYRVEPDGSLSIVGLQSATIKIADALHIDQPRIETRNIINAVQETFADTGLPNSLFFALIRYALSEQQYLDWAFKTSFISVKHNIRDLDQPVNYQRDNQSYVESFINEVKPYRTKIREYLLTYGSLDPWEGDVTDFDLPGYYDLDYLRYRSPNGDLTKDLELWNRPANAQWYNNRTLYVGEIVLDDTRRGSGYTLAPKVLISGGGGQGAEAVATINSSGEIAQITVTNPGTGYLTTPTVSFKGGNGSGAVAVAHMRNDTTRKISTSIKFDRITYDTTVVTWEPNVAYAAGTVISHEGIGYEVITGGMPASATFDKSKTIQIPAGDFDTANDRVTAYYSPQTGMVPNNLPQIFYGIEYPGVKVLGRPFTDKEPTEPGDNGTSVLAESQFDSLIRSTFQDLMLGTRPEDINISGGTFVDTYSSHAPEEFIPGIIFDTLDLRVYTNMPPDQEEAGISPAIRMFVLAGDGSTSSINVEVPGRLLDNIIVYSQTNGNYREGVHFNYNRQERIVNFNEPVSSSDTVFIYVIGDASRNEIYDTELFGDGTITEFEIPFVDVDLITDSFISIDGVKTEDYQIVQSGPVAKIVFDQPPAANNYVRAHIFGGNSGVQDYTEVHQQFITLEQSPAYPSGYTITLERPLRYIGPLTSNFIVEVNSSRLRPGNSAYYEGDGSTLTFSMPNLTIVDTSAIVDSDVEVHVNGVTLTQGTDYTIGGGYASITLMTPPATGELVIVTLLTNSDFRVLSENQILLNQELSLSVGDNIRIVTFSNHDMLKIRTEVFSGEYEEIASNEPGFDGPDGNQIGFDGLRYDGSIANSIYRPVVILSRPVFNTSYLWVTVNGTRRFPNYDFILKTPNTIEFGSHLGLAASDIIVVTSFGENVHQQTIGFRIFKDMLGDTSYLRISEENSTLLAEPLHIDDDEITVLDARYLDVPSTVNGTPGVVFIGGERITYYEIDVANRKLRRLRRGTAGTGAASVYPARTPLFSGSYVIPDSADQEIISTQYSDGSSTIFTAPEIDALGLDISIGEVQVFVGGVLLQLPYDYEESEFNNVDGDYSVISTDPLTIELREAPPVGREVMIKLKYSRVWYDLVNSPDKSLASSETVQAKFLKEKPCYTLV